ncbi:MAG: hypothetical protein GXO85_15610, partial [Chlorobi bacterium]|nr:hypothetical protein [Chlorobiota bacterium]
MKISKRIIRLNNSQSFVSVLFFHVCLFTFAVLLLTSCNTTEPPPSNQKLTLTAEDASCTEAWLNLKTDNISLPTEIVLKQNDSTIITANINSSDTTLYIENLLPSQTYTFQTIIPAQQNGGQASNKVSITTMDTTSHNFTWETFTFGGGSSSSHLSDVTIINENSIWAVGEIHTEETDQFDSNGVWIKPYNAVHWDGKNWELKRVFINGYFYPLYSIYAFDENDIWFANLSLIHWNGKDYKFYTTPPLNSTGTGWNINSIWGKSSKDFYVVGNGGSIAHYNGNSWRKIESSTKAILSDIYGINNDIYVAGGSNIAYTGILLKENKEGFSVIKEGTSQYVDTIFTPYFVGSLSSVWLSPTGTLYFGGQALYKNKYNK